MDKELEQGIDIYIKHIRKMAKLTDQQMALLMMSHAIENNETLNTLDRMNPDIMNAVDNQVLHVRQMQNLTDKEIRDVLIKNNMQEILREGALKRNLKDISNAAQDIRSNATKFARKVDML